MTADPGTSEGCLRKYFYEKKMGLVPPQTRAQTIGTELHEEIEKYLGTGEKNLSSLALSGLHMIPSPGPDLLIEAPIGGDSLDDAIVFAGGVPVIGYIDLVHRRGTNQGASDFSDAVDPPGTVEVIDWKTTSSPQWIKSPQQVANTIQMTTYGKWALTMYPDAEYVRLSHGYFVTKGRHKPRKVSLRVHQDQIERRWEYVDRLGRSIRDIVKETDPDKVPANLQACEAFRGCPHASYCTARMQNSLSSLVGSTAADNFFDFLSADDKQDKPEMSSLLSRLQANQAPKTEPVKTDVASEMKRLQREEVETKYPNIIETMDALRALGLGFPQVSGEAARVYAISQGYDEIATGYTGTGELGQINFTDPKEFYQALDEAKAIVAMRSGEPTTVEVRTTPDNPTTVGDVQMPLLPPEAPESNPALATEGPGAPTVSDAASAIELMASETPKAKKRGRPKKEGAAAKVEQIKDQKPVPGAAASTPETENTATAEDKIYFYVDCIPSVPYESFWPIVNRITEAMAKKFGGDDYRTTDQNGPLGFGRWKGVLAAALREMNIPGGRYVFDNSMSETGAVVVETMRDIVTRRGGEYVRGVR